MSSAEMLGLPCRPKVSSRTRGNGEGPPDLLIFGSVVQELSLRVLNYRIERVNGASLEFAPERAQRTLLANPTTPRHRSRTERLLLPVWLLARRIWHTNAGRGTRPLPWRAFRLPPPPSSPRPDSLLQQVATTHPGGDHRFPAELPNCCCLHPDILRSLPRFESIVPRPQ